MREADGQLGKLHEEFENEITQLHATWKVYRQLYADKESFELMQDAAGIAARIIHDSLLDSVILHIARLTDDAETCGYLNLSFKQLEGRLPDPEPKLIDELQSRIQLIDEAVKSLRHHRMKRLAHIDVKVALADVMLPKISRQTVEKALEAMRDFMHAIEVAYDFGPSAFADVHLGVDGESLLLHLGYGKKLLQLAEKCDREQMDKDELWEEIFTATIGPPY